MKKVLLSAIAGFTLLSFAVITSGTYTVDAGHSRVGFSIKHLGINNFHGAFDKYESSIETKGADLSNSTIQFKADAASVNTASSMRDEHLRSADYFNVEKFPTIEFKSKSVTKNKDNTYKVVGDLNFHGVTKSVELIAIENGSTEHPMNKKVVFGVTVKGKIKRSEFNFANETPAAILSDEVEINADLEYSKD